MAQATAICPGSIHICKARFTRLNANGTMAAGATSHVVTDQILSMDYTPVIEAGDDKKIISGCDCIPLAYRGYDKLMRVELKFQVAAMIPALVELLLGASLLVDTSTAPVPVGNIFPNQVSCSSPQQPPVGVELWTDAWQNDRQVDPPNRYIRWVFPMTFWQTDAGTLENDFFLPSFTGWTRQNPNWGNFYADWPAGIVGNMSPFAYFWDTTQPAASCTYSTLST